MSNALLDAALEYAGRGWPVLPLAPGDKMPLKGTRGVHDATTDDETIRRWWSENPDANLGIACGPPGPTVVDVDTHGGDGYKSLSERLPDWQDCTLTANTPRGGKHLYFTSSENLPSRRIAEALELKSYGTYVVAPPSVVSDYPDRYMFCGNDALAPLPGCLKPPAFVKQAPWSVSAAREEPRPIAATQAVLERATEYVRSCEPAIWGQGGHSKLLEAAIKVVHGFRLSDEDAFKALATGYNPRCLPPWDLSDEREYSEFCRKIYEARRITPQKQPGWLLDPEVKLVAGLEDFCNRVAACPEADEEDDEEVDYGSPLMVGDYKADEEEISYLGRPPGLAGLLCGWINRTSPTYQPMVTLPAVLSYMSVMFGHKITDRRGSRPNVYLFGVAPSCAGKDYAPNMIRKIAMQTGTQHILGGSSIASDAAIEKRLSEEPRTLYLLDEVGHFLNAAKTGTHYTRGIVSSLMRLYSASGSVYTGTDYASRDAVVLTEPCCSIYGTTTPEKFGGGFDASEMFDGWMSRCLTFVGGRAKLRDVDAEEIPEEIIEAVSSAYSTVDDRGAPARIGNFQNNAPGVIVQAPPTRVVIPEDKDATSVLESIRSNAVEGARDETLWLRGEENARKIAITLAFGCNQEDPVITKDIAQYSVDLVSFCVRTFSVYCSSTVTETEYEAAKNRIWNIVAKSGTTGIVYGQITKSTWGFTRKFRKEILMDLEESSVIASVRTKRSIKYWTFDNFKKTKHYTGATNGRACDLASTSGQVPQPEQSSG